MNRLIKNSLVALLFLAVATFTGRAADTGANTPPPASLEQRVSALEAYIANTDPTASMRDTNGNLTVITPVSVGVPGPGHNAWMMASAALVLFMTLPGLFLFYGGLVRRKNILSVIAQCFGIAGLVTILWVVFGYSTVFSGSGGNNIGKEDVINGVVGSYSANAMLRGVTSAPNPAYSCWVSQNVFSMYQLMFAIITPALILGSVAERIKFNAVLIFIGLWMVVVYFPLAHMIWGVNGAMNGVSNANASIHAIDFAGGTVVHMSSGWSALILCLILGKRLGFGRENFAPHSMVLCAIGTGMLWVGWYGFNAGSAVAADGIAANAFMTTTIATAVASFVWPIVEWLVRGKPSVLGFCSGAVAGLVVITPACGFVNAGGAIVVGIVAGAVPWFMCYKVKMWFGYDDALDTFGVHAIGGTLGAFLTGILAVPATLADGKVNPGAVNPNVAANVDHYINTHMLWFEQLKAIGVTLSLSIVGTVIIAYIVKAVVGLRPSEEMESVGLDLVDHGEEGYHGFGQ